MNEYCSVYEAPPWLVASERGLLQRRGRLTVKIVPSSFDDCHIDRPAMRDGNLTGDVQTQAEATRFPGLVTPFAPDKRLEDSLAGRLRNGRPFIVNRQHDPLLFPAHGHSDRRSLGSMLNRVLQEVRDDLGEVAPDPTCRTDRRTR